MAQRRKNIERALAIGYVHGQRLRQLRLVHLLTRGMGGTRNARFNGVADIDTLEVLLPAFTGPGHRERQALLP
ncbi:MAG: hypothetical protein A3F74_07595 [Betaproteobacteria bacterium RIFCSPLOWO2_12_FULL_62_58]|nr:MAG: hypothetical protein A3F74_07595 [Betaproteobacteria bacterium RIFCSPLOWO2_12_FULL_62_58]